jgi:DNA-binding transcriptional LysR family regulator
MDRLEAMTAFVAVAELRGFAPAARRLRRSPSSVTRLVASLEERLSVRLLQRTTRSVALTDAGARFLDRARRILAAVDDAEGTARAERAEPAGRFVVAAPSVFGRREVAPVVSDFLARHPGVVCELDLADRVVNLVEEGVDVAVRIGVLDDSSLVARKVGETRRVVVGSPRYLASRKRPRSPQDLRSHAIVHFRALWPSPEWRFVRGGREERVSLTPRLSTNSADAAIAHAEHGGGLTMVLGYQVIGAVRAGRLEVVLRGFEPPPLPIHVVYPGARLVSANVRSFIDLALETRDWRFVDF